MAIQSIGNTSPSSLVRSSSSLATAVANYQDQIQALDFANSAYTDDAFSAYQDYLNGRITNLNSAGGIANASKALTLTKTLESAMHSNVSASIQRENIQVMAGGVSLTDKYNVIASQYQRAVNNGDFTLAQTLESQAYSVSQTIQQQAQQASDASATLAKAAASANVSTQTETITNLKDALTSFAATAKYGSEKELNSDLASYANDPNTQKQLSALGVKISGSQPSYWDVVSGIAGAIYNHQVLAAQAEAPINPLVSRTYAEEAQNYLNGATKFQTLGGSLTALQIQQAQQDPRMFAFNNSTGTYKMTTQVGYQYQSFTDENGQTGKQLVPQYSGMVSSAQANKVYFLTPTETTQMTKLGLDFSANKNGTTGDGVQAQLSSNSPEWLKSLVGQNGIINVYTQGGNNTPNNGFLQFKAASSDGKGDSYYTLGTDDKGLSGLYEHTADGSTNFMGGDYGFNAGAVQLLVNQGEQVQQQVVTAQAAAAQALKVQQAQAQQQLQMQQTQAQSLAVQRAQQTAALQKTASPQQTVSPQLPTYNPQPATANPQQTVNGFNLNQSGTGGIKLGHL